MASPPPFSVVVIARDESRTLPRLLAGLEEFRDQAGEIVVVDTGSDDDTAGVARALGCRVAEVGGRFDDVLTEQDARRIDERFRHREDAPLAPAGERLFHFGAARQYASALASSPWVFHVDAGDTLEAFDLAFIDEAIRGGGFARIEHVLAYGTASLRLPRLYDRRRAGWQGRVHEVLVADADPAATCSCAEGQLRVRHHKDPAKPRFHYLPSLALDVLDAPANPRWLHYLGRELVYRGAHQSALPLLEQHAARGDAWASEQSESLCLAGACHEALEDMAGAIEAYERAGVLDRARRESWLRLAALYGRRGEFAASAEAAMSALAIPKTSAFAEQDANYGALPHALLYWALFWLGRRDEARAHWEICRRLDDGDPTYQEHARLFRS